MFILLKSVLVAKLKLLYNEWLTIKKHGMICLSPELIVWDLLTVLQSNTPEMFREITNREPGEFGL
jgi:hypothetical protein